MKNLSKVGLFAVVALVALIVTPDAWAAVAPVADEGTRVSIPIGQWIDNGVGVVFGAVTLAAAAAFRALPAHIQWALTFVNANENLGKALAYARAELRKKYGTISWSPDVKSEAVANALRYGRDHFPRMIEQKFGGLRATEEKLAARLEEWIEQAAGKIS